MKQKKMKVVCPECGESIKRILISRELINYNYLDEHNREYEAEEPDYGKEIKMCEYCRSDLNEETLGRFDSLIRENKEQAELAKIEEFRKEYRDGEEEYIKKRLRGD